jgi:hypothetical protein
MIKKTYLYLKFLASNILYYVFKCNIYANAFMVHGFWFIILQVIPWLINSKSTELIMTRDMNEKY